MNNLITMFTLSLASSIVLAQVVPPVEDQQSQQPTVASPKELLPPPINYLSGKQVALSVKEQQAVSLANSWKNRYERPTTGTNGNVVFTYGQSMPTIVCAPLYPCTLILQPGETVEKIDIGDPVRWLMTPSTFGSKGGVETTAIIIKPTDSGLTSATVIATDKRIYVIKLASRLRDWMPKIAFSYPEDTNKLWEEYNKKIAQDKVKHVLPNGLNVNNLFFEYQLTGDTPVWKPIRVYDDGQKTYIEFPKEMKFNEAPTLVTLSKPGGWFKWFKSPVKDLVNYRVVDNKYIVDKIFDRATLIAGVGSNQLEVTIIRGQKK